MAIIKKGYWLLSRELVLYTDAEIEAADNIQKELFIRSVSEEENWNGDPCLYRYGIIVAEKIDGELNLRIYYDAYTNGELDYAYDDYNYLDGGWYYDRGSQPARTWWCDDTEVDDNFYSWWTKNAYMRANAEVDLRTIGLDPGSYSLTAQADGAGKVTSPLSSTKDYTTDLEQLPTPVIEIEDGTLTITNYGEADTILVYANNKIVKRLVYDIDFYDDSGIFFRLPRLILPKGESTFYVIAQSKLYRSSERSNTATFAPTFYNINFKVPEGYKRILNPTEICYGQIQNAAYRPPNPAYQTAVTATNIATQTEFLGGGGDSEGYNRTIGLYNATDDAEVEVSTTSIGTIISFDPTKIYSETDHEENFFVDSFDLISGNINSPNTTAGVKLTFSLPRQTDVEISYSRSGWYSYNSISFSKIDSEENQFTHSWPQSKATLTYTNVPAGEHYIIVTHKTGSWQSSLNWGYVTIESLKARYNYIEGESDYMYPITWDVSEDILPDKSRYETILFPQSLSFSNSFNDDFDVTKLECEVTGAEYTFTPREADEWYPPRFSLTLSNATGPVHVKITEREN